MNNKTAIVVGGAGFTGTALTESLRSQGYGVYNVVRPNSRHISRLDSKDIGIHIVEAELYKLDDVADIITKNVDIMFYLAWTGGVGYEEQFVNVEYLNNAIEFASHIGCKRIIITGSQAEYGVVPKDKTTYEDRRPDPFSAYGSAKVASCYLSKQYADELGIEWVWGRIFSLIGKYEPRTRMLPALYEAMVKGEEFKLSSCRQNWDYLDVHDAADALIALAEHGKSGEIYNIANGDYRELREYVEEIKRITGSSSKIIYGDDPSPFVSLQPSVEKIYIDTGWKAKRSLADSIADYKYLD